MMGCTICTALVRYPIMFLIPLQRSYLLWYISLHLFESMYSLVQKQPLLRILHNPRNAFVEILARHGAALKDVPLMRSNFV